MEFRKDVGVFRSAVALTFDDVLLEPQYSDIASRSEVDLSTEILKLPLHLPIISANMDTVTGPTMAEAMHNLGGLGIMHRFAEPKEIIEWCGQLAQKKIAPVISVGVHESEEIIDAYLDAGAFRMCIDVAHGDSLAVVKMVKLLHKKAALVIAGNVATVDGVFRLVEAGASAIKVGIGPGSLCTTRTVTGHGVPQLQAILDCNDSKWRSCFKLIADGGIRNSGDIVKALAAGADAVMVGGLFAGTFETPGKVVADIDGMATKRYRGMASEEAQLNWKGVVSNDTPEGECTDIPYKGRVENIVKQLAGGIRSGFSYSGARNQKELKEKAIFRVVTANAVKENGPHGRI